MLRESPIDHPESTHSPYIASNGLDAASEYPEIHQMGYLASDLCCIGAFGRLPASSIDWEMLWE